MSDIFCFKIQKYLPHKKIDYPEARLNDHLTHIAKSAATLALTNVATHWLGEDENNRRDP